MAAFARVLRITVVGMVFGASFGITQTLMAEGDSAPEPIDAAVDAQPAVLEEKPIGDDSSASGDTSMSPLDESVVVPPRTVDPESSSEGSTSSGNKKLAPSSRSSKGLKSEQARPEPSAAETANAPQIIIPAGAEISQGDRVLVEGRGFSVRPPVGWIVQRDLPRVSLSLVAPVAEGQYPSNITVIRFSGSRLINQETAEKFAEKIVKDFPATSPSIDAYTLRNSQPIELADGRKAFLFYTDFLGSGRKMMQAHVLASSETNHYLISYTDTAENFEPNAEGVQPQVFNLAWESIASLELDSPNPEPSQQVTWILIGVGFFVVLWFVVSFVRNRRAAAEYRQFADRGHLPGDHDELISSLAQVGIGQQVSLEPTLMSMPKSEMEMLSPDLGEPLSQDAESVRGKKIKVAKRSQSINDAKKLEDLSEKASAVSSIEFSQDKFKREI